MAFVTPSNSKRNRDILTPESTSSDTVDFKRAKQLLSISSSEGGDMDVEMVREMMKEMKDELKEEMRVMKEQMVAELMSGLLERIESLESKVEILEKENLELKKCKGSGETDMKEVAALKARIVETEQYSRRASIRIYGLPEREGVREDSVAVALTMFKNKLGLTVRREDVDAGHRVGKRGGARPRNIIIKFLRRETKEKVVLERKRLKATGISMGDDLCKGYMELLNRLKADARVADQWVWMGKAYYKDQTGRVSSISYGDPIQPQH